MTGVAGLLCCCEGEPPTGCEECSPVTITWSGSCSYSGECCIAEVSGTTFALNKFTFTAAHTTKTSPVFEDLCVASASRITEFDLPDIGDECIADNTLFDVTVSLGVRLRFRLFRNTIWEIRVESSGDIPSLAPNEIGGTGFSLRFEAPISECPPATGWTFNPDSSTLPIVGPVDCDTTTTGVAVTAFSVGTVSVST
jgi:hypothetical protein